MNLGGREVIGESPTLARFQTRHFSGYILASGVREELPSLGGF